MTMLPDWMKELRPGVYEVDPDAYYPTALSDIGIAPEDADQYYLEVAHNWLKLDAQMAVRQAGHSGPTTLIVRGSEGYKERWGWRSRPAGKHSDIRQQDESLYARTVAREARDLYREKRGFVPA